MISSAHPIFAQMPGHSVPSRLKGISMTYEPSRRHFLRNAAVGAAVVGVASATPQLLTGSAEASTSVPHDDTAPKGPVTAYVRDHRTGEVAVMVGEHQVIHHDRALASKLAHIASLAK
jgi:hypothetical protein